MNELGHENWKARSINHISLVMHATLTPSPPSRQVRLAAMERISSFSQDPANAQAHCATLAQGVGSALPGWGEKNFQVCSEC